MRNVSKKVYREMLRVGMRVAGGTLCYVMRHNTNPRSE